MNSVCVNIIDINYVCYKYIIVIVSNDKWNDIHSDISINKFINLKKII